MTEATTQLLITFGLIGPVVIATMHGDLTQRRLSNKLVLTVALLSVAVHACFEGWSGVQRAIFGLLVGFALLLPLYACHMFKAGDVKFLAALGAFVGVDWILQAAATGMIMGGLCSAYLMLKRDPALITNRFGLIASKFSSMRMLLSDHASSDELSKTAPKFPYGVCLGLGALTVYGYQVVMTTGGGTG